ncbi:MAG: thiamine pyrophosphate-binding protein, partial [Planctomycetota bacterium]
MSTATPRPATTTSTPTPAATNGATRFKGKTGAKILHEMLVDQHGVDTMFGYPGGAILPVFDELYNTKANFILNRHEQASGHAADGYARACGKPGICVVTSGPGATNTVTPLATAQ